jgi:hypothetical protein
MLYRQSCHNCTDGRTSSSADPIRPAGRNLFIRALREGSRQWMFEKKMIKKLM